jgi:glycosyltransferase involved in cell wall biosynthesis
MNILNICTFYLRASVFKNMFDRLMQQGHKVNVFAPIQYGTSTDPLYGGTLDEYVKIIPCYRKSDRFWFTYKQKKIFEALLQCFDINQFDIIHSHTLFSGGYVAYQIFKKYNVPYVVTIRNTDLNLFFKYALHLRSIGVEILRNASKIIFISDAYKKRVINDYYPKKERGVLLVKSAVIQNGIDQFWIENIFLNHPPPNGRSLRLIFVGQIKSGKNIPVIIKTCDVLKSRGYDVSLTIVGKIVDRKLYEKIMVAPCAKYLPFATKEKLKELYRENDILVMPSKNESFGRVYAEAITQGLPIIYTKDEGFDGLFEDGFVGYGVKCNDHNEITDRIEDIIKFYNDISRNCSISASMFNWSTIINKIETVYNAVMLKGNLS